MKIFDMAIELEMNGEQFYRSLAEDTDNEGLKSVFNFLADDETKHKSIFENFQAEGDSEIKDTLITKKANSIFKNFNKTDLLNEEKQLNVYRRALELEQKSIEYYKELIGIVDDDRSRSVLEKIIREEERHKDLLDFLIRYISRPDEWVEDAEFYLKDEY